MKHSFIGASNLRNRAEDTKTFAPHQTEEAGVFPQKYKYSGWERARWQGAAFFYPVRGENI